MIFEHLSILGCNKCRNFELFWSTWMQWKKGESNVPVLTRTVFLKNTIITWIELDVSLERNTIFKWLKAKASDSSQSVSMHILSLYKAIIEKKRKKSEKEISKPSDWINSIPSKIIIFKDGISKIRLYWDRSVLNKKH